MKEITDIWKAVDEYVDENLDQIIEENDQDMDLGLDLNPSQDIQEEILADVVPDYGADLEIEDIEKAIDNINQGKSKENLDYWIRNFENMIRDYVPENNPTDVIDTTGVSSPSTKTILMGGGGILLLGLITLAAVLVRNKRNARRLTTMPLKWEPVIEEQEEAPIENRVPQGSPLFPFFFRPYPVMRVKARGGSNE